MRRTPTSRTRIEELEGRYKYWVRFKVSEGFDMLISVER
jgi:hypothetical protein